MDLSDIGDGLLRNRQMNKILFSFLFLFTIVTGRSQNNDLPVISPDRPGMATSPFLVIPHKLNIEAGLGYEKSNYESFLKETFQYNSTVLRYGLWSFAEARIQTDYTRLKADSADIRGFNPFTVGTKIKLLKEKGIIPATSLLLNITLPKTGKKEFRQSNLATSIYLLMQNNLTEHISICYNIGLEFDGDSNVPDEFFAICATIDITKKLSGFVENYNYLSSSAKPTHFVDAGFAYMIYNNLQIDLSSGIDLAAVNKYIFCNAGVAWRIPQ